jgi:hypothetical protein
MLQYLTGGRWGALLRRLLESSSRTLILLAVLFVPVLLGVNYLYKWTHEDLGHRSYYLNVPAFAARALVYFAVWVTISFFLNRWSRGEEGEPPRRFRLLSAWGLVLFGLTITFASIDWVMSLEPHWYSSIYPVLFATGQVMAGLAFAVAVLLLLATYPAVGRWLGPAPLRDLGNLLLAFVMLWAYMAISQFLLIWSGNLPEENVWYIKRSEHGWQVVALALAVLHFTLPFLLLLSRDVKQSRGGLLAVAGLILVMHFVDVLWWVQPAFEGGLYFWWLLDVVALAGLGGVWVWWFLWQLRQRPLVPLHDPALAEGGHE